MPIQFLFVILLAFTLCGEGMLTVTLTWTILDSGGSITQLGIILTIMSVIPFLIQKFSKKLKSLLELNPLFVFSLVRCLGIVIIIIYLLNPYPLNIYSLYAFAGLFSIILFLSTQSLEAYMSQKVLAGQLTSSKASNVLQSSIQIGAFGGNALAGYMMGLGGLEIVLYGLGISLAIGVLLPFILPVLNKKTGEIETTKEKKEDTVELHILKDNSKILWLTVVGIGILTVQLASYNFFLPVLFHDVYQWGPVEYGIVSSAAGLGALFAALVGKLEKFIPRLTFLCIAVFNIILGTIDIWYLSIMISFMLGFVFNRSRIVQRAVMFDFIKSKEESVIWSSRSTLVFQLAKAAIPLLMTFPLQWIGVMYAGKLFGLVGFIVSTTLTVIYIYEVKYRKKIQIDNTIEPVGYQSS
jgi:MFS family permease